MTEVKENNRNDIAIAFVESWIREEVVAPARVSGRFPICPFAGHCIDQESIKLEFCDLLADLEWRLRLQISEFSNLVSVFILIVPRQEITVAESSRLVEKLRSDFGKNDFALLVDHPDDPGKIGDLPTTNGQYSLFLVQRLSELNAAKDKLLTTDYYRDWSEDYYKKIVLSRGG